MKLTKLYDIEKCYLLSDLAQLGRGYQALWLIAWVNTNLIIDKYKDRLQGLAE